MQPRLSFIIFATSPAQTNRRPSGMNPETVAGHSPTVWISRCCARELSGLLPGSPFALG